MRIARKMALLAALRGLSPQKQAESNMSQQLVDIIDGQFLFSFFWPILVAFVAGAVLTRSRISKAVKSDQGEIHKHDE